MRRGGRGREDAEERVQEDAGERDEGSTENTQDCLPGTNCLQ